MKKLALLSLASGLSFFLIAGNGLPGKIKQSPIVNNSPQRAGSVHQNSDLPQRGNRVGTLQKVKVGSAGNLLTVLNSSCHQISVDSVINTVLFIHRNDQSANCCSGGNANVGQYRYDWSKDGGATYMTNVGVLNPLADNVTINGRYPQAMIQREPGQLIADSVYLVYDGTWHDGGTTISVWQGNYWGVAQLGGPSSTYTEARDTINHAKVEIFGSFTRSTPNHYWNITRSYVQTSTTTSTVDGLVVEEGVYDPATHATTWSSRVIPFTPAHFYDASGNATGDALFDPTIAFDPTGQYGWILFQADLVEDDRFVMEPQVLQSTDFGATWSAVQTIHLDGLPGMFENTVSADNTVKTVLGDAQITVDSAGNPHIAAVIGQADSTTNTFSFYTVNTKNVLYDISYDPGAGGCGWQGHYLSRVFGYSADYTIASGSDAAVNDNNRVQISRTDDGKKIFIFWNDSDSTVVAAVQDPNLTNPAPNMWGIGIDMSAAVRKITSAVNFTSGDSLVGGRLTPNGTGGALGGTFFNTVSQNVLVKSGGIYNIPIVVTDPDYRASVGAKSSGNPAQFYMCQNINFAQGDFVNKYDNTPPTLTVGGPDTVYVRFGTPYTPPTATAVDCQIGSITPTYTSTVHTDGNHNTDSIGVFTSTWTATNPSGNTATHTQTVIVADAPIARAYYIKLTGVKFQFIDSSLNFPTNRSWLFGDGGANNLNSRYPLHSYQGSGTKMVILTATNLYGTDKDTILVESTVGINDPAFSNTINVYPNPSSGIVNIDMTVDANDQVQATVFNTLGEVTGEPAAIKAGKTVLNLSYLSAGSYLLKIETASGKNALKQITITK